MTAPPTLDGRRARWRVAVALPLVIALGLYSRRGSGLPSWFATHAGDALWASCAYLGLAFCLVRARIPRLALCAFAIACLVEVSQLWRPGWLEQLRATTLGALLLGRGFVWADLPRYAVGVVLAAVLDRAVLGGRW